MPITRLALILCSVIVAAGITVFLLAQVSSGGQAMTAVLPLAMLAAVAMRALRGKIDKGKD